MGLSLCIYTVVRIVVSVKSILFDYNNRSVNLFFSDERRLFFFFFRLNIHIYFLVIHMRNLKRNRLRFPQGLDAGTSDDSGRASEQLHGSGIPRDSQDADSSRDHLSDVSGAIRRRGRLSGILTPGPRLQARAICVYVPLWSCVYRIVCFKPGRWESFFFFRGKSMHSSWFKRNRCRVATHCSVCI